MPRVTVVIPAYNAETFLPETLDSVEAQTYHDWEVVVADDASGDRTAEVVESRGGRFRAVRSEVNEGPAGARNRALREASGELVAFWTPTISGVRRFSNGWSPRTTEVRITAPGLESSLRRPRPRSER